MGLVIWLLFALILTFLLFAIFAFLLNRFYPEESDEATDKQLVQQRRKWIGLFVLVATIAIMVTSGINTLLNTRS